MLGKLLLVISILSFFNIPYTVAQIPNHVSSSEFLAQQKNQRKIFSDIQIQRISERVYSMPLRSTLYSSIIPGLGQINNKKWWKIPIIYGGLVLFFIQYNDNNNQYQSFLHEAQYRVNPQPDQIGNPNYQDFSSAYILAAKETYRRNRDLCVLGLVSVYLANVIDAYVDAKFFRFDISDDLSLKVCPYFDIYPFSGSYFAMHPTIKISMKL